MVLNETEKILTKLSLHKADNKVFSSDFNFGNLYCKFPILPPKPLDHHAPDLFSSFGYNQLIDIPTRVTATTTSLIDLVYTTDLEKVQAYGTMPGVADHDGIFVCFNLGRFHYA